MPVSFDIWLDLHSGRALHSDLDFTTETDIRDLISSDCVYFAFQVTWSGLITRVRYFVTNIAISGRFYFGLWCICHEIKCILIGSRSQISPKPGLFSRMEGRGEGRRKKRINASFFRLTTLGCRHCGCRWERETKIITVLLLILLMQIDNNLCNR